MFFEITTLWSRVQLNVEFYQRIDVARSPQIIDSTFILRGNICEGLLFTLVTR